MVMYRTLVEREQAHMIFKDFVAKTPDFWEYKEAMIMFITQHPQFDKPECVADVYKFVKVYPKAFVDTTSLDYILGLVEE